MTLIICGFLLQPNIESCSDDCEDAETVNVYREEWTMIFIIAAEIYAFGAIVYLLLGSGKKQPWGDGRNQNGPSSACNLSIPSKISTPRDSSQKTNDNKINLSTDVYT